MNYLKNLVMGSGSVAKALIAITGAVTVALTTHSWTNDPAILADIAALLVYLIPNTKAQA